MNEHTHTALFAAVASSPLIAQAVSPGFPWKEILWTVGSALLAAVLNWLRSRNPPPPPPDSAA